MMSLIIKQHQVTCKVSKYKAMRHLDELLLHYNRFVALWILSGTTRVSQHQEDKTRKVIPIWFY